MIMRSTLGLSPRLELVAFDWVEDTVDNQASKVWRERVVFLGKPILLDEIIERAI
jgi:hypothetical protein